MTEISTAQVPNAREDEEQQMSNENDEQNRAEETCPRCDGCGQLADSDDREPWSVWMAFPVGSALAVTTGLVKPEPCDECGGTGKAAGEHHTGTLDLTGEGNAPGSPVSDEAIAEIAGRMFDGDLVRQPQRVQDRVWRDAHAALTAAYPAIRQQVAEEIAAAIEQAGDERSPERHHAHEEKRDHGSTRYASYLDAASVARKIGAKA